MRDTALANYRLSFWLYVLSITLFLIGTWGDVSWKSLGLGFALNGAIISYLMGW